MRFIWKGFTYLIEPETMWDLFCHRMCGVTDGSPPCVVFVAGCSPCAVFACGFLYPVSPGMSWSASAADDSTSASALLSLPWAESPNRDPGLTHSPLGQRHAEKQVVHIDLLITFNVISDLRTCVDCITRHLSCLWCSTRCETDVTCTCVSSLFMVSSCIDVYLLTWCVSPVAGWPAPSPPASSSGRWFPSASPPAPSGDDSCSPPESHRTPGGKEKQKGQKTTQYIFCRQRKQLVESKQDRQ